MDLLAKVRQALLLNELDGNESAAYRFSNASASSGLSFGVTQLDVTHNLDAVACLKECGFSSAEIDQLKNKAGNWKALSPRLLDHKEIVDRYDRAQVKECLDHVMTVARSRHFAFADDEAIVHAADYNNQFYMSTNGSMAMKLLALGRPVTARDIYDIKMKMPWGQKDPDDVKRRYQNIVKLMAGKAL